MSKLQCNELDPVGAFYTYQQPASIDALECQFEVVVVVLLVLVVVVVVVVVVVSASCVNWRLGMSV